MITSAGRGRFQQFFASHPLFFFTLFSACLVALLYGRILWAPFVYDDHEQIQTNSFLLSWHSFFTHYVAGAQPFSSAFRGSGGSSYRPLFWLSLALDRRLFGLNVIGFHLTNLLLHWANGILIFVLLRRFGVSQLLAGATALIWLALPINSEAVAWASGRAYCLLTLFILLSLLFAWQYLHTATRSSFVYYCLAHVGALVSHEAGILVLPSMLLLAFSRNRTAASSRRSLVIAASGITFAYVLIRAICIGFSGAGVTSGAILPVGAAIAKYLGWIILPLHMSIERSTETPPNTLSVGNVIGLCGLVLLIWFIFRLRHTLREVSAGLAWTLLALAPFSGLIFLYQGMAERYVYLASIGLVLAVVSLSSKAKRNTRYFVTCILAFWVAWGTWRLNMRLQDWQDENSLYASSLKTDPDSPVLLFNLGSSLAETGDLETAFSLLKRSSVLRPDYEAPYRELGNIYLRRGQFENAREYYLKAIALQPGDISAITNLGNSYVGLRDFSAAERAFQRAISVAPKDSIPYTDLGILLFNQGKTDQALQQLLTAISVNPFDANPYYFVGVIEEQIGAREAALQMYKKALELRPDYAQARARLEGLQRRR